MVKIFVFVMVGILKTIMFVSSVIKPVYYVNIIQNTVLNVMLENICFSINVHVQVLKLMLHAV